MTVKKEFLLKSQFFINAPHEAPIKFLGHVNDSLDDDDDDDDDDYDEFDDPDEIDGDPLD